MHKDFRVWRCYTSQPTWACYGWEWSFAWYRRWPDLCPTNAKAMDILILAMPSVAFCHLGLILIFVRVGRGGYVYNHENLLSGGSIVFLCRP